jgi:hypothetical protein
MVGRTGSLSVICLRVSALEVCGDIRLCSDELDWVIDLGHRSELERLHDLCFHS